MASTYENDLRLEEMATGENSGSWGTKTNTNLELIADAFSYGTETIADADTTLTIADGAADAARSLALKINSSVDLTTTRTVTLAPNTTSKVWIIENNTSGGQTLTISAGSGTNITLANGTTKIIATDGIGAGSNVVELTQDIAIADLSVDGILSLADGTNSAPSLTNTGDTNTGLYFPAADEVGITVGGTQVFKADSTGIDVTGDVGGDSATISGDLTVDTDTLYVDSTNDRVGINGASPEVALQVYTADINNSFFESSNATGTQVFIRNSTVASDVYTQLGFAPANNILGGSIVVTSDEDFSVADNRTAHMELKTRHNGTIRSRLYLDENNTIFNEDSRDTDFRVESDTNTHLLYVDSTNNRVNIGINDVTSSAQMAIQGSLAVGRTTTTTGDFISGGGGNSSAYNGVAIMSNAKSNSSQNNTGLNSWIVDVGGRAADGVTFPTATQNTFSVRYWPAGTSAYSAKNFLNIGAGSTVINEDSNDHDFRVESDGKSHMLFVDAGNNVVQVNTSENQSAFALNVLGTGVSGGRAVKLQGPDVNTATSTSAPQLVIGNSNSTTGNFSALSFASSSGGTTAFVGAKTTNHGTNSGDLYIATRGPANGYLDKVYIGDTSMVINGSGANYDFRVESDGVSNMLLVDAGNNSVAINRSYGIAPLHVSGTSSDTVSAANAYAKITAQGLDGLAIGSITSGPFTAWLQSGYTANGYSPEMNNGYPLALNPLNANVVIGATNVADSSDGLSIVSSSRDNVSIKYTGTDGGHASSINFRDKRGATNARINNNLQDDGVGTAGALLEFATSVGGTLSQRLMLGGGTVVEAVFNDPGYDYDFRVESDSNANMFHIDAEISKAAFGTAPQTAIGGMVQTASLSVGAGNHAGYSVYSNQEGNLPSNTTVSIMDFEGPAYARYMKVTISGYQCRREVYFAGYQSWDNQSGGAVGDTTIGTEIFANGANSTAARCNIYLEVLSTSGVSGNPKYRLKLGTGSLSGQLYDTTSVVEFFNPPQYVTYQ